MKRCIYYSLLLLLLLGSNFSREVRAAEVKEGVASASTDLAVSNYYQGWKKRFLKPSVKVSGDYKIAFNRSGVTVSEAMGYGMLITVMMAESDKQARAIFDGLNRFRKRYPSKLNPVFMCWKVPASEKRVSDDSATDGDMDMAFALLLAHHKWGDERYLAEAKSLILALATTLVRPDNTLRLGDWDTDGSKTEMIRTSDLMPVNFRAFAEATEDRRWLKVESRSYGILKELQQTYAPATGLLPDFAVFKKAVWQPAKSHALEGPDDGEYSYNACRVPWRIGWAAIALDDRRAETILKPFMDWAEKTVRRPEEFKAGYRLDGKMLRGADFDSPCFIAPTGVAALALRKHDWSEGVIAYGLKAHEGYYEDSVNLLSLLVMTRKDGR